METVVVTLMIVSIVFGLSIPFLYIEWKSDKNARNYWVYDFKCPNCSAKSDMLSIVNFDSCCHASEYYEGSEGKTIIKGRSGSRVVCRRCGLTTNIVYYNEDLPERDIFYLEKLLAEKPPEKIIK